MPEFLLGVNVFCLLYTLFILLISPSALFEGILDLESQPLPPLLPYIELNSKLFLEIPAFYCDVLILCCTLNGVLLTLSYNLSVLFNLVGSAPSKIFDF